MDELDQTQERIDAEMAALIAARVVYCGRSANECDVCGLLIPSERQLAVPGCQQCVHCAADIERRR